MAVTEERPIGFGRLKRKEDPRFIRGQGNYVDDVEAPGMLHGAMLRSPLAHARIVSVDTSAALQHPKVRAVITGKDLEGLGLAWMPTLSADTQAVLATDKVRFQGQEVAFVVADDHYAARDALELIDVEYEPLPVLVDPRKALDADAPVIRDDKEGKTDNHIFDWEAGNEAETDAVFADADVVLVTQDIPFQRVHPCPLETCGSVADMDPVTGKLRLWCTTQAPHAHRTLYALVAGLPEHKIQVIAPDIGGGFGNKVPIYPGYVCSVVGSILTGKPVKWMEDRTENLTSTGLRARLPDAGQDRGRPRRSHPRAARRRPRRPRRVQRDRPADEVPRGVLPHLHRLLRPRGRLLHGQGRLHEQGAGRRRLPLLVPGDGGGVPGRAHGRPARGRARRSTRSSCGCRTSSGRSSSRTRRRRAGRTTRASTRRPCARRCGSPATTSCAASRPRSARAASTWASASRSSRRRSAPGRARTWTSPASAWPTAPSCASTRRARRSCASPSRPRARATRRRSRRSSPRSSASRPRTSRSCTATRTRRRSASAPTAAAPRRSPAPPPRWWRARSATRRG